MPKNFSHKGVIPLAVIYCNVQACAYRGKEVCTAQYVTIDDGDCKTACTHEQLMKQTPKAGKPENKIKK